MKRIVLYAAISFICCSPIAGQNKDDGLKDMERAKRFATSFSKELQKTKDLTPLLNKYFTSNPERILPYSFLMGGYVHINGVKQRDSERIRIAIFNFSYCQMLYLARFTQEDNALDEDDIQQTLPPQALQLVKRDPTLLPLLSKDGYWIEALTKIEHINSVIGALSPVTAAIRKYLNDNPQMWRPYLVKISSDFDPHTKDEPEKCNGAFCYGLCEGTEIFMVIRTPFLLTIIRDGNGFKIQAINWIDM